MKIRIKDDSLRLRLTQGEVNQFEKERLVRGTIHFLNDSSLHYTLVWGTGNDFDARFDGHEIRVTVPYESGLKWLNPEQVGMEEFPKLKNGEPLRLLIEKDFQCLSERNDEDESDMFPNPNPHC